MARGLAPTVNRAEPSPDDIAARALAVAQRTAYGVLGDRESAADVAQEVALQAVRRHHTLRRAAALDGWVARIAARAAIREAR
jgi:DNA-directed RNA polymerase specialized sigma24 family protein